MADNWKRKGTADLVSVDVDIAESVCGQAECLVGAISDKGAGRELSKSSRDSGCGDINGVPFPVAIGHDASGAATPQVSEEDLDDVGLAAYKRTTTDGDGSRSSAAELDGIQQIIETRVEGGLAGEGNAGRAGRKKSVGGREVDAIHCDNSGGSRSIDRFNQ